MKYHYYIFQNISTFSNMISVFVGHLFSKNVRAHKHLSYLDGVYSDGISY